MIIFFPCSHSQIQKLRLNPRLNNFFLCYCSRLNNSDELKDYLDTIYCTAAQYNDPPMYPVTMACGGIDGAPEGSDILSRIFAGVVAFRGNRSCYHTNTNYFSIETIGGWAWQVTTYSYDNKIIRTVHKLLRKIA